MTAATPSFFTESELEVVALELLAGLGYSIAHGPDLAPDGAAPERASYGDVLLVDRLRAALSRLNPGLPAAALTEAHRRLTRSDAIVLVDANHALHHLVVHGVPVEIVRPDGSIGGALVRVVDFADPAANDWLAVNQVTVVENGHKRRPDVVVYLNGLPIAVVELKNPVDEKATVVGAYQQLQTYKAQLPSLFHHNALLVASDGLKARVGSLTADFERFMPWRTVDGATLAPSTLPELEVLLRGLFDRRRLLTFLRHFIVFEQGEHGEPIKKLAAYHQCHAVETAVAATVTAARPSGDRRVGVVWHTQGSGKSLTMVFYSGRLIAEPAMENPTLVIITDRNDLDGQLFGTFARCQELLRQEPEQAGSRDELRTLLQRASGGVIFTTVQKFAPAAQGETYPVLTNRRNVVVIADEAHRSQYDFIDGFARHLRDALPNASFIGFTGTPIEADDRSTTAVFGDYISVYDIQQAVADGATVPIYYESRLAQLVLRDEAKPTLDEAFDEATEGEEVERKERLKTKWAALEALVGAEPRLKQIAADMVAHYERRLEAMDGKAMVVCMSRRICLALYREIIALRPDWHADGDEQGVVKVVMTGSASDPLDWQPHIRNKARREKLAERLKDPADPFRIVIVRDMWLTGFDAPCLHTMYLDKPMHGHGLMQAIARVNRVFKDKPGGLVVDYLGLADQLKRALADYTQGGGKGRATIDQNEAVAVLLEKHEVCCSLFHGFDWSAWAAGTASQRLALLPTAQEHVLAQQDGQQRFYQVVAELSKAFALSVPHPDALRVRDDVGFFQAVKAALAKSTVGPGRSEAEMEHAIRQLVSRAVAIEGVVDVFAAAGLQKPDLSILSDEFLADVRDMPQRNLAVELLRKLLEDELKTRSRRNLVQSRSFAEMLERSVGAYRNRAIETAQVIEELIALAKQMREAQARGDALGLTDDEVAFYEALEVNDSAVAVLGDAQLRMIAQELTTTIRANVTVDWSVRESVRAKLRLMVKRILKKYGYPPDKQEMAVKTVIEQAELLTERWAA